MTIYLLTYVLNIEYYSFGSSNVWIRILHRRTPKYYEVIFTQNILYSGTTLQWISFHCLLYRVKIYMHIFLYIYCLNLKVNYNNLFPQNYI